MVAGETGEFLAPLLPVGTYSVKVEKAGFAPFVQNGVILEANTSVQVRATMQVQAASQNVVVSANQTLVQANATNLVQVIDERRIVDLPLNGRNVLQLVALDAGIDDRNAIGGTEQVNTLAQGAYASPFSVNGSRGNGTNFLLDNADNNDGFTNIAEPFPNPDAVEEFSIQTSTFDAQYGRGVGGVVNVVTKSGTNSFHGTAFDFLRNYDMNAANFFSGRDALKRNQFGATIGGPVLIPSVYNGKDRTFFFFSYQGTRQSVATPGSLAIAPSNAMKQGDFSGWLNSSGVGAIKDPLSNGFFPNNQIPVSRFDPVAAKLVGYMPSSFTSNYQLRFGTPAIHTNDDQVLVRLDHTISAKQRVSFRYFVLNYNQPWAYIPSNLYFVNAGQTARAQNATFNHTYSITPRLLNDLTITYHRSSPTAKPPTGLPNLQSLGADVLVVPNFGTMDIGITGWTGITESLGYFNGQTSYQIADNVSYAMGKHEIRFGIDLKRYRIDKASYFTSGGNAAFGGQLLSVPGQANAGTAFAEFLLGQVGTWQQFSPWSERMYDNFVAPYVQDNIRLTPKLTVNLGVRWDPKFPYHEIHGKQTTFIPGEQSTVYPGAPLGIVFPGDPNVPNGIIRRDWNNFAPRVGLAYQLTSKTVIRSGFGVFYDQLMAISNNHTADAEPFIQSILLTAPGSLANVYNGPPALDPSAAVPKGSSFVFHQYDTWALQTPNMVTPYTESWNLVLEHQLKDSILLRAAYVGNKGTHLLTTAEINPAVYGPGATAANYNQRRIYQPIGALEIGKTDLNAEYDALQLTFKKNFGHGVTVLGNYTYSKSVDYTSYGSIESNQIFTPFNYRGSRGPSDFDTPQRLVLSGVWELPSFKNANPVLRAVAGGWQNNFIFTDESGTPITIVTGVDNLLEGTNLTNYPNLTGVNWQLPSGRAKGAKIAQWFNTAAFARNPIGVQGTGGRNQLRGPAFWNADYSLFKSFSLRERLKLQVRGEFFNVFNHANLGNPQATLVSPTFGQITTASAPRILQVAMKLIF